MQLHTLHGLSGEVEIIGIICNVTCRHFLPLLLFIDDIAVIIIDIAALVLLRHQAAAARVVFAVCIPFCKQTVLCDGKLAVCLFECYINLGIIVLPAAVGIRRQFQVVDACLNLKVQRAVEIACRVITCNIGVVICAVEAVIFRRGDLEYQRFTAALCGRIRPCQTVRRVFCRRNISGKVPLCQLNAPAGILCLCHGKCLLFPRLIGVFQIVVVHQIVLVPVPYIFRQLECDNHLGMEDASAVTIVCLRLTGNLSAVPEHITIVKVAAVILIRLTGFHFVQIFCISGKALLAHFCLFSSYHVFRLQRRGLCADFQCIDNAGILHHSGRSDILEEHITAVVTQCHIPVQCGTNFLRQRLVLSVLVHFHGIALGVPAHAAQHIGTVFVLMGQQNVRIRIGGRKSVIVCIRTHGQGIIGSKILRAITIMIVISHLSCRSNRIHTFIRFTESIIIIIVDERLDHCRRAYGIRIILDVSIYNKPIRIHPAGNIRIIVQIVFQQIFVFRAVYHIIRLCIGEGLDAEIVQAAIPNRSVLFPLFCQFRCGHCLFGIVFLLGKNLYHIPLCGIVIVDFGIIECLLICQIGNGIFVVQFPVQRLVILGVVRGITGAVCRNRNNAIGQNIGDNRQRKRTLLPAVCAVAVQRFFINIIICVRAAVKAICIPVIIVLHMDIDPVDFTLCFGVVLLYVFAVHLGFIAADSFADGCPAAYQRFPQHGSGAGFRVEHGGTAAVTVNAVIVGKMIAAVFLYHFLVLNVIAIDRRRVRRSRQVF